MLSAVRRLLIKLVMQYSATASSMINKKGNPCNRLWIVFFRPVPLTSKQATPQPSTSSFSEEQQEEEDEERPQQVSDDNNEEEEKEPSQVSDDDDDPDDPLSML